MSDGGALPPWHCADCGEAHDELPAATISAPVYWEEASEEERIRDFELTADTCVWKEEHFFVRGVLEVPLVDREGSFDFGVWSSLSRENFELYTALGDSSDQEPLEAMFGWFSNRLPLYPDTLNLKCMVHPRRGGLRPLLELEPTDHPLAAQQRDGIAFADAVAYLHRTMDF